jgi:hypothetical protein
MTVTFVDRVLNGKTDFYICCVVHHFILGAVRSEVSF